MKEELERVYSGLRSWAQKHAGAHYHADDLVSDTIIDILEHPEKWDPSRGTLLNLLFSMLRNRANDAYRTYYRDFRRKFRRVIRTDSKFVHKDEPIDDGPSADDQLEALLDGVPKQPAEAFRLFFGGKDHDEIARHMGVAPIYVKSLIHRARVKLRERLRSA